MPTEHHEAVVAYHDACYLGRYNQVYDEGRRVVDRCRALDLVEMELHHRKGMCCGAGGARMWMEEREGQRINHRRVEHALATEANAIATACPYCLIMLRDGETDLERTDVAVRDVAECWPTPPAPGRPTEPLIAARVNGIRVVLAEMLRKV